LSGYDLIAIFKTGEDESCEVKAIAVR